MVQLTGRGGPLVGPNAQLFPKNYFDGSPYLAYASARLCEFIIRKRFLKKLIELFCIVAAGFYLS